MPSHPISLLLSKLAIVTRSMAMRSGILLPLVVGLLGLDLTVASHCKPRTSVSTSAASATSTSAPPPSSTFKVVPESGPPAGHPFETNYYPGAPFLADTEATGFNPVSFTVAPDTGYLVTDIGRPVCASYSADNWGGILVPCPINQGPSPTLQYIECDQPTGDDDRLTCHAPGITCTQPIFVCTDSGTPFTHFYTMHTVTMFGTASGYRAHIGPEGLEVQGLAPNELLIQRN
ncbi:hypothetical protein ACJ41O_011957 [Fusarium nematophilum]